MERRDFVRHSCEANSLILLFGCHFRGWISDWSPRGIRLVLAEDLRLDPAEHFIMYSDRFDVLHAEVVWRSDDRLGARIHNWRTAAVSNLLDPAVSRRLQADNEAAGRKAIFFPGNEKPRHSVVTGS